VASSKVDSDLQAFTSEFQVTNASSNFKQLRAMMYSSHPQAKKVANDMLKTSGHHVATHRR
jgi:hypothetical protein